MNVTERSGTKGDHLRQTRLHDEYPVFSDAQWRRLVAAGVLPSTLVGRARIIARADVEHLLAEGLPSQRPESA